jgi:hypothetical protein
MDIGCFLSVAHFLVHTDPVGHGRKQKLQIPRARKHAQLNMTVFGVLASSPTEGHRPYKGTWCLQQDLHYSSSWQLKEHRSLKRP